MEHWKKSIFEKRKKVQAFWKNVDADTANVLINYENNSWMDSKRSIH